MSRPPAGRTPRRTTAKAAALTAAGLGLAASARAADEVVLDGAAWRPADATEVVQAALSSGARRVVLRAAPGPWSVRPLAMAGGCELVLERGAVLEAVRGAFRGRNDSLLTARLCTNIAIRGDGATLRMWRADYAGEGYAPAEWRHAIQLRGVAGATIEGLRIEDSGGDGVYVGAGPGREPCRDVTIRDVVCDRNHRQGISVIHAENLRIERARLLNTRGTPPMAGIDFEPNHPWERLVGCVMVDCEAAGNRGAGFLFALHQMGATSTPVSVRLERCRAAGNDGAALVWSGSAANGPTMGGAEFVGCEFLGDRRPGADVRNPSPAGGRLIFRQCRIEASATGTPPVTVSARRDHRGELGGVEMWDVALSVPPEAPPIGWRCDGPLRPVSEVAGRLAIAGADGREYRRILSVELLGEWNPDLLAANLPRIPFDPCEHRPAAFVPAEWRLRHQADLAVWSGAGEPATLAVRVDAVGTGTRRVRVRAETFEGREVVSQEVDAGPERVIRLADPDGGPWRVRVEGDGAVFRVRSPDAPLSAITDRGPLHFFGWTGSVALRVPARTGRWAVRVAGSGGEGVRASLADPSGRVVETRDNVTGPVLIWAEGRPDRETCWRLDLDRPSRLPLEDFSVEPFGCAPVIEMPPPR